MEQHPEVKVASTIQDHSKESLWSGISATQSNLAKKGNTAIATIDDEVVEVLAAPVPKMAASSAPKKFKVPTDIEVTSTAPTLEKTVMATSIAAALQGESVEASALPAVSEPSVVVTKLARFPHNLPKNTGLFLGQNGKAYFIWPDTSNPIAVALGSKKANNLIRKLGQAEGVTLRKSDLNDINHILQAEAETAGINRDVWYRVAEIQGGIELDIGDEQHSRLRIANGMVELVTSGSETLFYRTQVSKPMVIPAAVGNLKLLKKYVNLHPVEVMLFTGWLSYTLAHPKVSTSKFLILVLQGNEGSGKSFLCWLIMMLIDPSILKVQLLPSNAKDLAIAAQNAHLLCYDNLREISPAMSDILCTAATGGTISNRQLYSDADQNVLYLHVALVLNGIHSFVDQPDLAQRCLPVTLLPFSKGNRKSEAQITKEFLEDLPAIMRGLFDLIAQVFKYLPTAEVTKHERMIDFVQWLAAMEQVDGAGVGMYQAVYSDVLNQGQLDTILDNVLSSTLLEFAHELKREWTDTPTELLIALNNLAGKETARSRDWPQNPIAMSKRLAGIQASLRTQGIHIDFCRGKNRTISIRLDKYVAASKSAKDDDDIY